MSSSQQQQPRLTTRQAAAQAQRRAMNERRQMLTQRIRKQKKSDWLAQKRGIVSVRQPATTSTNDLGQTIHQFIGHQQPPNIESLNQLQAVLQQSTPWTLDDQSRLEQAQQLVQKLEPTLHHFVSISDLSGALTTVQVLLQLVALSSASTKSSDTGESYYGRRPPTWSELLLQQPRLRSTLPTLITLPPQQQQQPTSEHLQVMEQTCWLIGNWTQDCPSAATELRTQQPQLLQKLVALLNLIQQQQQQQQDQSTNFLVLIQAAAWAYANLLKGDAIASAWHYCGDALFTPQLASQLLTLSVPVIRLPSVELEKSCIDISVQTAWILVQVSQREDQVLEALLQTDNGVDLIRDVLERLFQVCQGAQQQQASTGVPVQQSPGRPNYFHHPLLEPCLEVLGHVATGCNGRFVPRLLAPTPPTSRVSQELALLPILQELLKWGQQGLLQVNDYLQLLWVCGCLLCDAGIPNHPSTTVAAPVLVPLLTMGLQDNPNARNSRVNSLECKREGVLALWNALNDPPPPEDESSEQFVMTTTSGDTFLAMIQLILNASSNDNSLVASNSSNTTNGYATIQALKNLLLSQDVDAMLASLQVLNAILRNVPSTRVSFVELEGDQALETVCDLPLGNDAASNQAADLAADLLDDFFDGNDDDDDNHQFADPMLQPATDNGAFVFGLPAPTTAAPIFLPDLNGQPTTTPTGATLSPVGADTGGSIGLGRGHGRGRGRGHTLPAWAQAAQQ